MSTKMTSSPKDCISASRGYRLSLINCCRKWKIDWKTKRKIIRSMK